MTAPDHFHVADGYAHYSPQGDFSLEQSVDLMIESVMYARTSLVRKLLIDTRGLHGFRHPTVFDRFFLSVQLAQEAAGWVKIAIVARPELVDPHKFGITVARNRGLQADVFTAEPEALQWLLGSC
jgi:hypothetical protein